MQLPRQRDVPCTDPPSLTAFSIVCVRYILSRFTLLHLVKKKCKTSLVLELKVQFVLFLNIWVSIQGSFQSRPILNNF
jgi:hypothetical protein